MGRLGWCILRQTDAAESEIGVRYAHMCIKTAVYVSQENLDQGSLLVVS